MCIRIIQVYYNLSLVVIVLAIITTLLTTLTKATLQKEVQWGKKLEQSDVEILTDPKFGPDLWKNYPKLTCIHFFSKGA